MSEWRARRPHPADDAQRMAASREEHPATHAHARYKDGHAMGHAACAPRAHRSTARTQTLTHTHTHISLRMHQTPHSNRPQHAKETSPESTIHTIIRCPEGERSSSPTPAHFFFGGVPLGGGPLEALPLVAAAGAGPPLGLGAVGADDGGAPAGAAAFFAAGGVASFLGGPGGAPRDGRPPAASQSSRFLRMNIRKSSSARIFDISKRRGVSAPCTLPGLAMSAETSTCETVCCRLSRTSLTASGASPSASLIFFSA